MVWRNFGQSVLMKLKQRDTGETGEETGCGRSRDLDFILKPSFKESDTI